MIMNVTSVSVLPRRLWVCRGRRCRSDRRDTPLGRRSRMPRRRRNRDRSNTTPAACSVRNCWRTVEAAPFRQTPRIQAETTTQHNTMNKRLN